MTIFRSDPIDELRAALTELFSGDVEHDNASPFTESYNEGVVDCVNALDTWAEKHPGLTIVGCDTCGKEIDCRDTDEHPLENCKLHTSPEGWTLLHFGCEPVPAARAPKEG